MKNYKVKCSSCDNVRFRKTPMKFKCYSCKDGRTQSSLWKKIRGQFLLDNPFCKICGTTRNLCVHHIDENPRNDSVNNLETRCVQCHPSLHKTNNRVVSQISRGLLGNRLIYG